MPEILLKNIFCSRWKGGYRLCRDWKGRYIFIGLTVGLPKLGSKAYFFGVVYQRDPLTWEPLALNRELLKLTVSCYWDSPNEL